MFAPPRRSPHHSQAAPLSRPRAAALQHPRYEDPGQVAPGHSRHRGEDALLDELLDRHAVDQWYARRREFEKDRMLDELLLRRAARLSQRFPQPHSMQHQDQLVERPSPLPTNSASPCGSSVPKAPSTSSTPPPGEHLHVRKESIELNRTVTTTGTMTDVEEGERDIPSAHGNTCSTQSVQSASSESDRTIGTSAVPDPDRPALRHNGSVLSLDAVENASIATITKEVFKRYDQDGDGLLNKYEWNMLLKDIAFDVLPEDKFVTSVNPFRFKNTVTPSRASCLRRLLLAPPMGSICTVEGCLKKKRINGQRGRVNAVRRDGLVEVNLPGGQKEWLPPTNLIWD